MCQSCSPRTEAFLGGERKKEEGRGKRGRENERTSRRVMWRREESGGKEREMKEVEKWEGEKKRRKRRDS